MVTHSNSYSYGPNHSKTELMEIQTKWPEFYYGFQWFLDKMARILFKMEHHWKTESLLKTKQRVTLGIPNVFGIPAHTVVYLRFHKIFLILMEDKNDPDVRKILQILQRILDIGQFCRKSRHIFDVDDSSRTRGHCRLSGTSIFRRVT